MAALLLVALLVPAVAFAQGSARLQIIHNNADPALSTVDGYLTIDGVDAASVDDLEFRNAAGFLNVSWSSGGSNPSAQLGLAQSTSTGPADTATTNGGYGAIALNLNDGDTIAVVVSGDLSNLAVEQIDAREQASAPGNLDLYVHHGSPDAPAVDLFVQDGAVNGANLVTNLAFGNGTGGYVSIAEPTALHLTATGGSPTIGRYLVDTTGLIGGAGIVVASGYAAPMMGQPAFDLYVALPTGGPLVRVQPVVMAQIVHNCADPAAQEVDVYAPSIDANNPLWDDFAFRSATEFVPVPVGLDLSIAPGTSASVDDSLFNFSAPTDSTELYHVIASGTDVLGGGGFAPNPEGIANGFEVLVLPGAVGESLNPTEFSARVLHGATDAPAVDVFGFQVQTTLVDSANYKDATPYIGVPSDDHTLYINVAANDSTVAAYTAAVESMSLSGGAGLIMASGFLDPSANQNGESFGLFVVLPDGTVDTLDFASLVQVVHNAADPALEFVDVYVDGIPVGDNFQFRSATGLGLWVNAGVPVNIDIATDTSSQTAADADVNLAPTLPVAPNYDEFFAFHLFANGVANPADFVANPEGNSIAFDLFAVPAIPISDVVDSIDFRIFHGATDAPAVDVAEDVQGLGTVATAIEYGQNTGELTIDADQYGIDVIINSTGNVYKRYSASLGLVEGSAPGGATPGAAVFASGFVDTTAANQNGPEFGLYAVLPSGLVLPLTEVATSIDEGFDALVTDMSVFPNPANNVLNLEYTLEENQPVSIRLMNMTGQVVETLELGNQPTGQNSIQLNVADLPNGVYLYNMTVGDKAGVGRVVVSH